MPNLEFDRSIFTLQEVANSISRTILLRYSSAFWVQAEMNKLNFYQRSGHCYPELVEKRDGKIIAQMKATLWKEDYARIDARFRSLLMELKFYFRQKLPMMPFTDCRSGLWILIRPIHSAI
jgi:exodeoxyribonuclease VII large subunit